MTEPKLGRLGQPRLQCEICGVGKGRGKLTFTNLAGLHVHERREHGIIHKAQRRNIPGLSYPCNNYAHKRCSGHGQKPITYECMCECHK